MNDMMKKALPPLYDALRSVGAVSEGYINSIMTEFVRASEREEEYTIGEVSRYVLRSSYNSALSCMNLDSDGGCIPQCKECTLHNCYHYDP